MQCIHCSRRPFTIQAPDRSSWMHCRRRSLASSSSCWKLQLPKQLLFASVTVCSDISFQGGFVALESCPSFREPGRSSWRPCSSRWRRCSNSWRSILQLLVCIYFFSGIVHGTQALVLFCVVRLSRLHLFQHSLWQFLGRVYGYRNQTKALVLKLLKLLCSQAARPEAASSSWEVTSLHLYARC